MDFFDMSKKFQVKYLEPSQTEGFKVYPQEDDNYESSSLRSSATTKLKGRDYVKEYKEKELRELKQMVFEPQPMNSANPGCDDLLTSVGTMPNVHEIQKEELTQVYDKYDFTYEPPKNLTIHSYRSKILSIIDTNPVTVITGPTGCGKTTQVPQYILNHHAAKNVHCNIIVTQPRRIAAISIAKRVCAERSDWELGSICGYKVGLKGVYSEDTRLLYVTVGVLLQMLISKKNMNDFTHIILDEVHERDQDMDFLLLIVKKLLYYNSRNVKIILMSATVDSAKFARYYQTATCGILSPSPVIDIQTETNYKVYKHYLEDLSKLGALPKIAVDEPKISQEAIKICVQLIKMFDVLDKNKKKKSVLIFLPGIYEIEELYKKLQDPAVHSPPNSQNFYKWFVLPLHSTITETEQADVFKLPPADYRKIILATNIAESSITVPDIKYVIDFCLTKTLIYDYNSNYSSLQLAWAAKSNCTQRAGRVGRVMDGRVYRMVPRSFYEELNEEATPEMLRSPLDKTVLQSKLLDMGEPKSLLALALDPPDLSNIERTILVLKELGGLNPTCNGRANSQDGDITFLGRLMAKLPVDTQIAKLILLGYVYSVLPECIVMGAAMSVKSVFSSPFQSQIKAYNSKLDWADGTCSDCIAFLNVYDVYKRNQRDGYFERSVGGGEHGWAKRHFIQLRAVKEVELLVDDLTRRLKMNCIEEITNQARVRWNEYEKALVLKLVLAGAFYPNYFGRGARGGQINEQDAVRTVGGRDPFKTVYLQNFPSDQPGYLYSKLIHDELDECNQEMNISYDESCKVYVEFTEQEKYKGGEIPFSNRIPGKIPMAVYRAVKICQIKKGISIRLLPPQEAHKRVKKLGLPERKHYSLLENEESCGDGFDKGSAAAAECKTVLPGVNVTCMELEICYFINPGHFWVLLCDDKSRETIVEIQTLLNATEHKMLIDPPEPGKLYAVPYFDDTTGMISYYRGRVQSLSKSGQTAKVHFIDFGNTEEVKVEDVKDFDPDLSRHMTDLLGQAIECRLCNIKPSTFPNAKGDWTREAHVLFHRMIETSRNTFGDIYSVVNSVVSIDLYVITSPGQDPVHVNQELISQGLAEPAEESFLSKINHDIRCQQVDPDQLSLFDSRQGKNWNDSVYVTPPDPEECKQTVQLRGPRSPLEMKLFSYTREGMNKQVIIANDSVNSVLLDSDPQDSHERLVVSAHVSQNTPGTNVNLRHTTIVHNIHGLPAIICMLFSPRAELRVNKARTQYTGVLCGLGTDARGQSLFPEREIELVFDTVISFDDANDINYVRFWMSILMHTETNEEFPQNSINEIIRTQNNIKMILLRLMKRSRPAQELTFYSHEYKWNMIEPDIVPADEVSSYQNRLIYPLHKGFTLKTASVRNELSEKNEMLKKNIKMLHELNGIGSKSIQETECKVCTESIKSRQDLRIHLSSLKHKELEKKIMTQ